MKIVENYSYKDQSRRRVVPNLGSPQKSENKEPGKLIKGLCRLCETEDLNVENLKNKDISSLWRYPYSKTPLERVRLR